MTTRLQKSAVDEFFNTDKGWQGELYGEREDHYSQLTKRRREYVTEMLRRTIPRPGGRAADLGCGAGLYLRELDAMGYHVVGMDMSAEMVKVAGERFSSGETRRPVGVVRGDIEFLPFRPGSFSLILAIGVLDYLLDDERAIAGIHRALQPGGVFLVNVRNENALTALHYTTRMRLKEVFSGGSEDRKGRVAVPTPWIKEKHGWTFKKYHLQRFEQFIGQRGFERVDGRTFGYDFKALGSLGLTATARRLERWCDRVAPDSPLPYVPYSGMAYIGLFRKG